MADVEPKIVTQVEYYYGDVNMLRDKFMQNEVKRDNGWISVDVLLKFNRLKQICDNPETVLQAISTRSTLLEVDLEKKLVRRREENPLPTDAGALFRELGHSSVYVKGFDRERATLDTIKQYLGAEYDPQAVQITLRKDVKRRAFKGSVFIAFKTKEIAQKFLDDPNLASLNSVPLTRKWRNDYFEGKKAERNAKKDEMKKLAQEVASKRSLDEERERAVQQMPPLTPGLLLRVTGIPPNTGFMEMRKLFGQVCEVTWIEIDENSDSISPYQNAVVRFGEGAVRAEEAWRRLAKLHPLTTSTNSNSTSHASAATESQSAPVPPANGNNDAPVTESATATGDQDKGAASAGLPSLLFKSFTLSAQLLTGDEERRWWEKLHVQKAEHRMLQKQALRDRRWKGGSNSAAGARGGQRGRGAGGKRGSSDRGRYGRGPQAKRSRGAEGDQDGEDPAQNVEGDEEGSEDLHDDGAAPTQDSPSNSDSGSDEDD